MGVGVKRISDVLCKWLGASAQWEGFVKVNGQEVMVGWPAALQASCLAATVTSRALPSFHATVYAPQPMLSLPQLAD